MSDRTGLGPLEVAVLQAVASQRGRDVPTARVLGALETEAHLGPDYTARVVRDLGVPWRVPLQLLRLVGNWGSAHGDPPADARYTRVGLSEVGQPALRAEQGELGPVPVELINGSVYRGGQVPPLDPTGVVRLLLDTSRRGTSLTDADASGLVRLPTEGVVDGNLVGLAQGRRARILMSCRIEREPEASPARLVITGTPLAVDIHDIERMLRSRIGEVNGDRSWHGRGYADYAVTREQDPLPDLVRGIQDETSSRTGTRIVIELTSPEAAAAALVWARGVWPVTVEATWQVPGGLTGQLQEWVRRCAEDVSGLEALATELGVVE